MTLQPDRLTPLFDADTVRRRVTALGAEIAAAHPGGPLTVICILKGSVVFTADLVRAMPDIDVQMEFLGVSSYEGTESTGEVRITHDLHAPVEGRHLLVVEDIVDTGLTLHFLRRALLQRHPASLKLVTLLDKPSRRRVDITPDHCGFTIEDHFVVGYGLDLDQSYRHLDHVAIYDPS